MSEKIPLLSCTQCNEHMFPVYTPQEYITCPLCGSWENSAPDDINYCKQCKIIFSRGCIHGENDNSNCYNGALMVGFIENDKQYNGMLVFDNDEFASDFLTKCRSKNINLLMRCMCSGKSHLCQKADTIKDADDCSYG
jgi:hypothetical protein